MLDSDDKFVYFNEKIRNYTESPASPEDLMKLAALPRKRQEWTQNAKVKDESVYDFLSKHSGIENKETLYYNLDVLLDATIRSYYAAGASEISARTCNLTSNDFHKTYQIKSVKPTYYYKSVNAESISLYATLSQLGAKSLRFKGGWSILNSSIISYLQSSGVTVLNSHVDSILDSSRQILLSDGSLRPFDQIICTTNSQVLSKIYPKLQFDIPHRTWTILNLGYENPPHLPGFGYAVPGIENSNVYSAIFNYNCFPSNKPTVTLLGTGDHGQILKEFLSQTNFSYPNMGFSRVLQDSSPQYSVGHYLQQEKMLSSKPDWLQIGGHSFFHSGIPSCIIRSKEIVSNLL